MTTTEAEASVIALKGVAVMVLEVITEIEYDGLGQTWLTHPHRVICVQNILAIASFHA